MPSRSTLYVFLGGLVAGVVGMYAFGPAPNVLPCQLTPGDLSPAELALDQRLSEVWFQDVPLDRAVEQLSRDARISIDLDMVALRELSIQSDAPITLRIRQGTLDEVLQQLLAVLRSKAIGPSASQLTRTVRKGRLVIDTGSFKSRDDQISRTYDVGPLLRSLDPAASVASAAPANLSAKGAPSAEEELQALLMNQVAVGSWWEQGGFADLQFFGDHLVISQTRDRHREISHFLHQFQHPVPLSASAVESRAPEAARWHAGLNRWVALNPADTEAKLETIIDAFVVQDVPLRTAVQLLCDKVGVSVAFGLPERGDYADVWSTRHVSYNGRKVQCADILDELLNLRNARSDLAGQDTPLSWGLHGSMLVVASADTIHSYYEVLRVYDVRPLLNGINAPVKRDGVPSGVPTGVARSAQLAALLIAEMVTEPSDRRGFESRITDVGGRFVIRHGRSDHRRIASFMSRLRIGFGADSDTAEAE